MRIATLVAALFFSTAAFAQSQTLNVVTAGPNGELSSIDQVKEIRITFSEPMVALGRIPKEVKAPYVTISPAIAGSFRWSGTTLLIFTADPKTKLPFATKYTVTVDASAQAVSGAKLGKPFTFSFTTPTVRLLQTSWRRSGDKSSDPIIFALRFNQPIDPQAMAAHLHFDFVPREVELPQLQEKAKARLTATDASAVADFQTKVAATTAASKATGVVLGAVLPTQSDKLASGKDVLIFQTRPNVATSSSVRVRIDARAPSLQGPEVPGVAQEFTAELEPTLFVRSVNCDEECDPDYGNDIEFTTPVELSEVKKNITVWDVTDPAKPQKLSPSKEKTGEASDDEEEYDENTFTLEEAGYDTRPARTYFVTLGKNLQSKDGQTLGYTWGHVIEYWHQSAFSSFGDGHGVWEAGGGAQVPFYARNLSSVTQWLQPLTVDQLMPTIHSLQSKSFRDAPETKSIVRKLNTTPDKIQSFGFDVSRALNEQKRGLAWAAVQDGPPIARAHPVSDEVPTRSTVIQVTDLGISVKDSPANTLVFVTKLSDGQPVEGAKVSIRNVSNDVVWSGVTDKTGLAIAPNTALRANSWELAFIVTAEKDGDVAYVGSDWNEGVQPWDFGTEFDLTQAKPILRGSFFSDRGVYKLGEEVHLKLILRADTPNGMQLVERGRAVKLTLTNSQGETVATKEVALSDWSSAEWLTKIPDDAPFGTWTASATIEGMTGGASAEFLVAAYRRPDFRVDVTLAGEPPIAGTKLKGVVTGKYLFGAAMAKKNVAWTYTSQQVDEVPDAVTARFPYDSWSFLEWNWDYWENSHEVKVEKQNTGTLDKNGNLTLDLATDLKAGVPRRYTLEGEVTDTSRQKIAGRNSILIHPAPWYIGLKRPSYFVDVANGVNTELVAVTPEGRNAAGVSVKVSLVQVQWNSVRRAEGNGFYTWDTERQEVPAGETTITSAEASVPVHLPLQKGGYYILRATAADGQGRSTTTTTDFYAMGGGYTAWERYDHNRIDLVAEKSSYKPGETARIMVKSPWESATALLTTEREGVRSQRVFQLTSTQQTVEVPISERDIPNVFVSVLLVRGRTNEPIGDDGSDPGKPAFRLGYVKLKIDDASKQLKVDVRASKDEFRPGSKARVEVSVRDAKGKAVQSEVTLWAVDYGVLSLTNYQTPDVRSAVWIEKALQVLNEDSRQRIISRRVMTPKGADEGGGGGASEGPGMVRKDFRVLAFWLGSLTTNGRGELKTDVTLPESLTTYRIMAVAADKQSRFGSAEKEIRTNKPVLLKQAFPRFLTIGDQASFGSVVHNQLKRGGGAVVTMRTLDPDLLEISGDGKASVNLAPESDQEVKFNIRAKAAGNARVEMTVRMGGESDAFQDVIPIRFVASPETVAAYGVADPEARETVKLPESVVPNFGGLHIDVASTALVGLSEGAKYLIDYPYGCAEQRSSAALALMLASDLGDAFNVAELRDRNLRNVAQNTLNELGKFQCSDGGYTYWAGECQFTSPYLTSWIIYVIQRSQKLGYVVNEERLANAVSYLNQQLAAPQPQNAAWWPAYSAWQAFAVKVLAEAGQNVDTPLNRLYERLDRMPVFALAYLDDALLAKGENGARHKELRRRIMNAVLTEAGASHVEELNDPYLLYFWNSNVRSTAIVLDNLVRGDGEVTVIRSMVRWLMDVRKNARWGNTQENAWAMAALVDFYRKYESVTPDFAATVSLATEPLMNAEFRARSTKAQSSDTPMPQLLAKGAAGSEKPLVFRRDGKGTMYYTARMTYASAAPQLDSLDAGFRVERRYALDKENAPAATTFKAGDLIRVTLTFELPKERRFVAVTDPLPAGVEAVEAWFATTSSELAAAAERDESGGDDWLSWWRSGGFDHIERHDDHVLLFATRLSAGKHVYSYLVRATTSGSFKAAPTHVEEMYRPEIFGRTSTAAVEVTP